MIRSVEKILWGGVLEGSFDAEEWRIGLTEDGNQTILGVMG